MESAKIKMQNIKGLLILFMIGLIISGITAFPLEWELRILNNSLQSHIINTALQEWFAKVYLGVADTNANYPFMSYGTDWLAFAHIGIAIAFIGPLRNPIRNIWVVEWGMILSLLVFPLAFVAGPIRGIPFFHQLIDCTFGVVGFIMLFIVHKQILQLEKLQRKNGKENFI